jgi:hypothetical protein
MPVEKMQRIVYGRDFEWAAVEAGSRTVETVDPFL